MADTATPYILTLPVVRNGVNVTEMTDTIEAVRMNPAMAKFNFRLRNKWMGGEKNRSTMKEFSGAMQEHRVDARPFVYDNGEHQALLGDDKAPNPLEWLLHALVGCMTTTTAYHAAAQGIQIGAIDSSIEGDIDLRGFLGLSEKVRKGYSEIRVAMRVTTSAPKEVIEAMTRMSPVYDTVSRSVPVKVTITTR